MRRLALPIFACALILAGPTLAAERPPEAEIVDKLNDPVFQDDMVATMSDLMRAMMDLPVGEFAAAIDKAIPEDMRGDDELADIDPDATLGELTRRDDPDFERNMEDKMRQSAMMMGIFASEFGALLPKLRALGERMKDRLDNLPQDDRFE